jgi:hypothetical protein
MCICRSHQTKIHIHLQIKSREGSKFHQIGKMQNKLIEKFTNFQKKTIKMESEAKYWKVESLKQIYVGTTKGRNF